MWLTKAGVKVILPPTLKTEIYWYYEVNAATGTLVHDYGYQLYTLVPEKGYLVFRSTDRKRFVGPGRAVPVTEEISRRYGLRSKPYLDFGHQSLLVRWKNDTAFSEAINALQSIEFYPPNLHQVRWSEMEKSFFWVDLRKIFEEFEYENKLTESSLVEKVTVDFIPLKVHPGMAPKFDLIFSRP